MRIVALLLLLPALALAQAPGGQVDRAKMLEQMKQSMLPMMEQSLPELERTRECVRASSDSAQLKECAAIMEAFQKRMMAQMGMPQGGAHQGAGKSAPPQQPDIEWSPEVQKQVLQGLDMSIKQTSAMKGCLQSSQTPEQMDACMKQSGLAAQPRRQ
ncbi:MAG: hypothetical protein KDI68_05500 [Gammaproteobacteria bacterium]|nr:hypothetical protein [Gammaproteobacteria bacterium]